MPICQRLCPDIWIVGKQRCADSSTAYCKSTPSKWERLNTSEEMKLTSRLRKTIWYPALRLMETCPKLDRLKKNGKGNTICAFSFVNRKRFDAKIFELPLLMAVMLRRNFLAVRWSQLDFMVCTPIHRAPFFFYFVEQRKINKGSVKPTDQAGRRQTFLSIEEVNDEHDTDGNISHKDSLWWLCSLEREWHYERLLDS